MGAMVGKNESERLSTGMKFGLKKAVRMKVPCPPKVGCYVFVGLAP